MSVVHYVLYEAGVRRASIHADGPNGCREIFQEMIHVGAGGATVNANADAFVVHLCGVARGAGKTEKLFALVGVFYETNGQRIRIAQSGLLRKVVVVA